MDALLIVIIVAAIASLACWLLSLITRDTSWVDRAWSIVPVVYVWIFVAGAFAAGDGSVRVVLMGVLATAWGARLTFNFARKGGYSGMEDYRWAILRRMDEALAVPGVQCAVHHRVPDDPAGAHHTARLRRRTESLGTHRMGCGLRDRLRRLPRG